MRRSPLAVIYLTVFIDLLGFSIILPLLPFYAEHFGATGVWVGALLTAYSAAQFLSAPFLGRLSDRIGRRPVLLMSLAGSALSLALTGVANTLYLLLLGRALAGLFGGSIATGQAYIADVTRPQERAKYMGMLGACIGLGFVFGPAIGAGFSGFGFGTAAFVAAGLAALNFVFAYFKLAESRTPGAASSVRVMPSPAIIAAAWRHPAVGRILAATFLTTFAFTGMEATFALFSQQRFSLDPARYGLVFTYLGVVIVIVQGGAVGRLSARYGERALALTGALILALSLLALTLAPSLAVMLAILGVLAVGQGFVSPTLATLLSRESAADEQGSTLGLGQSFAAAARATGPLVAGWLFDRNRDLPYVLGGALVLVVGWLMVQSMLSPAAVPNDSSIAPTGRLTKSR